MGKAIERNPVAKNLRKFNKAVCHANRKAKEKAGYKKHSNRVYSAT